MADRVILPRALDSNGDIVPAAEAYFYETGTTTPATVYSDSAGTVVVSQPVTADSAANFAATYATEVLKVDIQDPDGVSLPGFPSDPHYQTQTSSGSARLTSFTATADIPQTNVQDAVEQVQTNVDDVLADPTITGTAAFTGTVTAPTPATSTDSTTVATTAYVRAQVLDEDDMVSDDPDRPPSQQSVKAYVLDKAGPQTTLDLGLLSGGNNTAAHSLGVVPDFVSWYLECETADAVFSIGDRVYQASWQTQGDINNAFTVWADGTNVGFSLVRSISVATKTGTFATLTSASWRVYASVWV